MEKLTAYAFPSDSDEFLPPTPPPVRLCQASRSLSRAMTAPTPPVNLASTRLSARQERGSKSGSASQPPPQLHYKDWTTPKLLKVLFEKSIPIPVGGDRMSLFLTYCEALSAEPIFPPRLQASAVRPSSSAIFSVPVPAAHTQDSALAAQLPLPAQSAQPQHLPPQSLTSPVPSSSSTPQVTFNQLQTLLQPIIDSQLALSARLDKLENPSSAPPAFSSSTPAYTFGVQVPSAGSICLPKPSPDPTVSSAASRLSSTLRNLLQSAQNYMSTALAPSSRASYSTAWSAFLTFCAHNRIHPIPFNQDWILAFIVHAKESLHLSPASIKSYISGIQYHYRIMSVPSPIILSIPVVRLTLRGILKSPPPAASPRLPILILSSVAGSFAPGMSGIVALSQRPLFYPVFGCWVLRPWDERHRRPQSATSFLSCLRLLGPSPLG
ncbi:UNVERIFIED_CONTAM: hypothetical protein FKN15_053334 [Acipenser sinensis]